jgi:microcystin-dependent protein
MPSAPSTQLALTAPLSTEAADGPTAISALIAQLESAVAARMFSAGDLKATARASAPTGWLMCDGTAVSRTTYADLFTAIGTTYGIGNGSTTFNLPDLRGRAPIGVDGAAARIAASDALGQSGGAETHTLTTGELPAHNHGVTDPGHSHSARLNSSASAARGLNFTEATGTFLEPGVIASNTTGISVNNAGGGGAHSIMQPYQVVNYMIRT